MTDADKSVSRVQGVQLIPNPVRPTSLGIDMLRKLAFYIGSAILGVFEISILWLACGNVFRYFVDDSFLEVVFLFLISIVGPLLTLWILRRLTREWRGGIRRDLRTYSAIGLVTATILMSAYMLVIDIVGFGYRGVRM
jgi:hypothetical protein